MKSAVAILVSNLLLTGTGFAVLSLSRSGSLTQHLGLVALGLVLVAGIPLLIALWPPEEIAPWPATATSAVFGMVHLP